MDKKYKIGIDEVGRGPIAGPVCVSAFLVKDESFLESCTSRTCAKNKNKNLSKLRDSKKLSKKQREEWFEYLKIAKTEGFCDFSVSFVSSENIDKFGIAKCIQKALDESLERVILQNKSFSSGLAPAPVPLVRGPEKKNYFTKLLKDDLSSFIIFLDGGLKAKEEYINQETIIKGDELHPVISLASIVAKVSRDKIMEKYGKEYPEYGFEKHVGYGTKTHYKAIKKHGQTPIHRKTFIH